MDQASPQTAPRPAVVGVLLISSALAVALFMLAEAPGQDAGLGVLAAAAYVAGALSFLSPCTLPLLPACLAVGLQAPRRALAPAVAGFFVGVAATFAMLGAGDPAFLRHLPSLTAVGGALVMAAGALTVLGQGPTQGRPGLVVPGAFLLGATVALGWTACVGPVLGMILTLLAGQGVAVLQGLVLAGLYSLGLGSPLIVAAAGLSRTRFWRMAHTFTLTGRWGAAPITLRPAFVLSGLLLIGVGYLLASGQLTLLSRLGASSELAQWVVQVEDQMRHWLGVR